MYLNLDLLFYCLYLWLVKPIHRMYLNSTVSSSRISSNDVKPIHRMYLNSIEVASPSILGPVKPIHRMYLNNFLAMSSKPP